MPNYLAEGKSSRLYRFTALKFLVAVTLSQFGTGLFAQSLLLDQIEEAIAKGSVNLSLRYRFESVHQDNLLEDAAASTLRSRLTLKSGMVNGFSALLEIDDVTTVGADRYDSLVSDKYRKSYSVIADPVGTEINQALVKYEFDDEQAIVFGKQRIIHAKQRFIGGVGWRQNEQTYDALSYRLRSERFDADYSYIWNVSRIFAGSKTSIQATDFDSDSHIGTATFKSNWGNLSSFFYALGFDNAAALSSLSYGISYSRDLGLVHINASAAKQSDYGSNPLSYDSTYLALDAGFDLGASRIVLGYDSLGSDKGISGFKTPLATLHLWQGWADQFLSTPASGIEDIYITVSGKLSNIALLATYHKLKAEQDNADFGSEWDFLARHPISDWMTAELKFSSYHGDGLSVDTEKLWFSFLLSF